MTPYYEDEHVTLYHGDALDVLDALTEAGTRVDAVVTDPPYASGARTEAQKSSSGAMLRGARWAAKPIENDQMTTIGFVYLMRAVALRCREMLPDGGSLLSFIDWRQGPNLVGAIETCNYRVQGMVVWDKGSFGLGNGFRAQHELICHASKGTPTIYDKSVGNVLGAGRVKPDDHPSPKPVGLMESLIGVVTPSGGVVLDPFAGSGSTLVAAKNLGRKAIGIEAIEAHAETTARRLAQGVLDLGGAS